MNVNQRDFKGLLFLSFFLSLFFLLSLCGCSFPATARENCTLLLEDNPSLHFTNQVYELRPNESITISIGIPHGERISSVNYADSFVSSKLYESENYDYYHVTFHHVTYSCVIRFTTSPSYTTSYVIDEGTAPTVIQEESPHLRYNTLPYQEAYARDGFVVTGWNTNADNTGEHIGFGSRFDHSGSTEITLYLEKKKCTPNSDFTYELTEEKEILITGYHGYGDIIIPSYIEGYPVTGIATHAFADIKVDHLILPPTMKELQPKSFGSVVLNHFTMFDNISIISDEVFQSYEIHTLHINAVNAPVYSGTYFDTFPDKMDYLSSIKDEKKIVLFCGSSARFGYDSSLIEASFPGYKVANMGVYAYSNMLPQADIIRNFMGTGDILLSSPEFDSIDMQFCRDRCFQKETFCMVESNYDLLTLIDTKDYSDLFSSFFQFLESRAGMEPGSYLDSPSFYNEEKQLQSTESYNKYGDYILPREDNKERKVFGVKRAFYNPIYFTTEDIQGINSVYDSFSALGVQVFFTYSPRSNISISEDSTPSSIEALDQMLHENLHAEIISEISTSLMDPLYFYNTDNHLSSNGVRIHTKQIINDLSKALGGMKESWK